MPCLQIRSAAVFNVVRIGHQHGATLNMRDGLEKSTTAKRRTISITPSWDEVLAKPHTHWPGKLPIHFGLFADGSGYVFNLDTPRGVHYLPREAAEWLSSYRHTHGNPLPIIAIAEPSLTAWQRQILSKVYAGENDILSLLNLRQPPSQSSEAASFEAWLHITNACNLSCQYCFIPTLQKAVSHPTAAQVMSTEVFAASLDGLINLCKKRSASVLRLKFAGGEPSLVPGFIDDCCLLARQKCDDAGLQVEFSMLSNGTALDDQLLSTLKKQNFSVSISIDGNEKSHNAIRFKAFRSAGNSTQRVGTWKQAIDGASLLQREGLLSTVLTVLTPQNAASVHELTDWCVDRSIPFRLNPVKDDKAFRQPETLEPIFPALLRVYGYASEKLPNNKPFPRFALFADWTLYSRINLVCGTCNSYVAIKENGNVASCEMTLDRSYGNVSDAPLDDTFLAMRNAPENWRFKSPERLSGGCSSCLWRGTCGGGCPEHTKTVFGTYDSSSPWCRLFGDFLPHYLRGAARQIQRCVEERT